jgi:hypothetical protein
VSVKNTHDVQSPTGVESGSIKFLCVTQRFENVTVWRCRLQNVDRLSERCLTAIETKRARHVFCRARLLLFTTARHDVGATGRALSEVPEMILDDAMRLHRQRFCLLPLKPKSKIPALKSWTKYQTERPPVATLRKWFAGSTRKNIGVILGPVSGGLICRDFDRMDAFDRWAGEFPQAAATLPQSETSRGRHVFCRADNGAVESVSPTGSTIIDFGDGELRGGGYSVLPPSVHESGKPYTWLNPIGSEVPLVDLASVGLNRCWSDDSNALHKSTQEHAGRHKNTQATQEHSGHRVQGRLAADFEFSPIREDIDRAIAATLPTGPGRRNKAVFELCRHLKSISALAAAEPLDLRAIVMQWHHLALPTITTTSPEETLADFLRAWPKVKFPAGSGPLKQLFDQALADPFPHCAARFPTYEMKVLVALCRKLSEHWLPSPFPLSCRVAGELLEVSHTAAAGWLFLLVAEGVLDVHEVGTKGTRRASEYFYRGDRSG